MEDSDGNRQALRRSDRDTEGNPGSEQVAGDASASARVDPCLNDERAFIAADAPPPNPEPIRNLPEVIVGWRAWLVSAQGTLQSTFMHSIWEPGVPMRSCCSGVPGLLRHGIHAFKERSQAEQYARIQTQYMGYPYSREVAVLVGEVSLWGTVILHEHGYRAQFAYPRSIGVLTPSSCDELTQKRIRRDYGIA
jgi:hypothetical protein